MTQQEVTAEIESFSIPPALMGGAIAWVNLVYSKSPDANVNASYTNGYVTLTVCGAEITNVMNISETMPGTL